MRRRWILLLSGASLAALLALGMSLSELDFQTGQPFRVVWDELTRGLWAGILPSDDRSLWAIVRILIFIYLWALVPAAILYSLLSAEGRRRLLTAMLLASIGVVVLFLLSRTGILRDLLGDLILSFSQQEQPAFEAAPAAEISSPPNWLRWVLNGFLVVVLSAAAWFSWRRLRRGPPRLEQLAHTAQVAIDDLEGGGSFADVVRRCYFEMSRVLRRERGVQRELGMTPREFEFALQGVGLPEEAIHRLTRLFEAVRYGEHSASPGERKEAVGCLEAVVRAVESPA